MLFLLPRAATGKILGNTKHSRLLLIKLRMFCPVMPSYLQIQDMKTQALILATPFSFTLGLIASIFSVILGNINTPIQVQSDHIRKGINL